MRSSWRDVQRHKCHFCLAFCSVFIVVLSTLIVTSVVAQGPLIFVNLTQVDTGEMDVFYVAQNMCIIDTDSVSECPFQMNEVVDQARGFNFTQIETLYGQDEYNLAPRMHIVTSSSDQRVDNGSDAQIYFIDLAKEKEINVGVDWPYPDLAESKCVLT